MRSFVFDTVEQANSIIAQLPSEARGPESGLVATPLSEGRYQLSIPDEFVGDVEAADPELPVPVPTRTVRKSVVMARADAAGKIAEGFAVLQANPVLFARWFAPDRPTVNSTDPDTIAFLQGIGLNAEAMLAPEDTSVEAAPLAVRAARGQRQR